MQDTKGECFDFRRFTRASTKPLLMAGITLVLGLAAGCAKMDIDDALTSSISPGSASTRPVAVERKADHAELFREKPAVKVASNTYLGRAPYICTPSGFGRTSTCFAR